MRKYPAALTFFGAFIFLTASFCVAQDDETRQGTGLPMKIGENAASKDKTTLSGKITIQGLNPAQPKPSFIVVVYFSGAVVDRRQVDDKGNYFVPNVPREGSIVALESNSIEVARYQLPSSIMGSVRQDFTINLPQGRNDPKPAVISVNSFYKRSADNEKIFGEAMAAAHEKRPDAAVSLFEKLVSVDPSDFVAWTELGTLFFKNKKYSDAENSYQKALELKGDFIVALINLGKLYLAQNQSDKAITILTKAVEVEPTSADANHYLGEAYLQIKKGSKAVIYLNEALRLAPVEKAEIHLRLAALYNGAGLKDKAVAEYKAFLEKIPNSPDKEKIEKYIKENSDEKF